MSFWVQAFPSLHGMPLAGSHVPLTLAQAVQPVQVVVSFCQYPSLSHVCGCAAPLHCFDPGVQTPVQAPLGELQTKTQGGPLFCHW